MPPSRSLRFPACACGRLLFRPSATIVVNATSSAPWRRISHSRSRRRSISVIPGTDAPSHRLERVFGDCQCALHLAHFPKAFHRTHRCDMLSGGHERTIFGLLAQRLCRLHRNRIDGISRHPDAMFFQKRSRMRIGIFLPQHALKQRCAFLRLFRIPTVGQQIPLSSGDEKNGVVAGEAAEVMHVFRAGHEKRPQLVLLQDTAQRVQTRFRFRLREPSGITPSHSGKSDHKPLRFEQVPSPDAPPPTPVPYRPELSDGQAGRASCLQSH